MLTWCIATAAAGSPLFGVEVRPIPRPNPSTVPDVLQAAVAPPLAAYGGARWGWVSVVGSFGVAQRTTRSSADGAASTLRVGLLRPGVDLRLSLLDRPHGPEPYVMLGGHITLPVVADVSDAYTDEEQASANVAAAEERRRLGRFGARAGGGAIVPLRAGLGVGAQVALEWSRGFALAGQPGTVSSTWTTDASLLLQFEW